MNVKWKRYLLNQRTILTFRCQTQVFDESNNIVSPAKQYCLGVLTILFGRLNTCVWVHKYVCFPSRRNIHAVRFAWICLKKPTLRVFTKWRVSRNPPFWLFCQAKGEILHHFVQRKPDEKRTGTSSRRRCAPEVLPPNSLEVYKKMTTTPVPAPGERGSFLPRHRCKFWHSDLSHRPLLRVFSLLFLFFLKNIRYKHSTISIINIYIILMYHNQRILKHRESI